MSAHLLGIIVAALGGAAVGVERQRTGHASGTQARFGGVRTFTLLGGVAGMAGWLITLQLTGAAVVLMAGAAAVVVAGYVAASRRDIDATTEVAALVVLGAGVAAGLGWMTLASGVIALTTLLLVEKSRLHAAVGRINDEELRAAARFGVMAIVILPLLPEGPVGPLGGVKPRELWLLVLFFTGLSFIGYLARRMFGAGRGYPLAGLLAGLISSTNATLAFARLSRRDAALSPALAMGTIAACTMLFPRIFLAGCVLNLPVGLALLPYFVAPFALGLLTLAIWWRGASEVVTPADTPSNPLQIGPALQMAVLFQIVIFAVQAARQFFGPAGLLFSGAVLGLTNVDALTISMTRSADTGVPPAAAAQAIAVGILVNCVMKAGLAVALGAPRFHRLTSAVLGAMAAVIAVALGAMH